MTTALKRLPPRDPDHVTNDQLQAAFLAARELGKVLDDDVLRAIIIAARKN